MLVSMTVLGQIMYSNVEIIIPVYVKRVVDIVLHVPLCNFFLLYDLVMLHFLYARYELHLSCVFDFRLHRKYFYKM